MRTSWVVLLAMLVMFCAPVISQIMNGGQPWSTFMSLCRSGNFAALSQAAPGALPTAPSEPNQPNEPRGPAHFFEHCPYCALQADMLALPPAPQALPPSLALVDALPTAFLHGPYTLHAWRHALARAPPCQA